MATVVATPCRFRVTAKAVHLVFGPLPDILCHPPHLPLHFVTFSAKCSVATPTTTTTTTTEAEAAPTPTGRPKMTKNDNNADEDNLDDVLIAYVVQLLVVSYIIIIIEVSVNLNSTVSVAILVSSLLVNFICTESITLSSK